MYIFTSLSCFYFECFSQFSGIDMRTVEPDRHFRGLFYLLCHYVGSNMHDCGDTHDSTDTRVSGDMRFSGDTRSVLKRVSLSVGHPHPTRQPAEDRYVCQCFSFACLALQG